MHVFRLGFKAESVDGITVFELGQARDAAGEQLGSIDAVVFRWNKGHGVQFRPHLRQLLVIGTVVPIAIAGCRTGGVPRPQVNRRVRESV